MHYLDNSSESVRRIWMKNNPARHHGNPRRVFPSQDEVRLLEMLVDAGGNSGVTMQFFRDVATYGVREAFIYLKGYAKQGMWRGNLNAVRDEVNSIIRRHKGSHFASNPWLVAGPHTYTLPEGAFSPDVMGKTPSTPSSAPLLGGGILDAPPVKGSVVREETTTKVKVDDSFSEARSEASKARSRRQKRDRHGKFKNNPADLPGYAKRYPYAELASVWHHPEVRHVVDLYRFLMQSIKHGRKADTKAAWTQLKYTREDLKGLGIDYLVAVVDKMIGEARRARAQRWPHLFTIPPDTPPKVLRPETIIPPHPSAYQPPSPPVISLPYTPPAGLLPAPKHYESPEPGWTEEEMRETISSREPDVKVPPSPGPPIDPWFEEYKKKYLKNPHATSVRILASGSVIPISPANGRHFSLEELQGFVDGSFELVNLPGGRIMVVNEEGLMIGLPLNAAASKMAGTHIMGNVAVISRGQIR